MHNVFEEIIKGKIPCNKVFENDRILAFRDIAPQAPVHILIVPKKSFANLSAATQEDQQLLGEMLLVAQDIAKKEKIEDYRVITNNGPGAGQMVYHFHLHLLGGRQLGILG
jgi:histidine triad (HIT) family protein